MAEQNEPATLSATPVLVGTGYALAASLGVSVLLVLFFFFTSLSERYIMPVVHSAYGLCALGAGWVASRKAGARGLIYGLLAGLSFFAFTVVVGYFVPAPAFPMTAWWKKMLYALAGGSAGGIAGIAWKE
ncbi:TIGR04086 family membrane protein [Heliobacterium undosum]|uniref:TIGR04086 family membrane protein n=1 Tax=Heliomicrobium undosum TaxID=121734 RepID=A0A845L2A9_9FIRM|nr:TIGR04086 family membrane protein [Heliomicrobium undosum]MZP28620.1 TIGR04086 family membrane protein [Heliomicrobium undosum]